MRQMIETNKSLKHHYLMNNYVHCRTIAVYVSAASETATRTHSLSATSLIRTTAVVIASTTVESACTK